jgi:hypothetical protein
MVIVLGMRSPIGVDGVASGASAADARTSLDLEARQHDP